MGIVMRWTLCFMLMLSVVGSLPAAEDELPEPDGSRVLLIVELSGKYPGIQQGVGHPLERLAGIAPHEAKRAAAWSLQMPHNQDAMIRGYEVRIESDMTARAALEHAEKAGIGTVALVTLLQRSVGDVGSSEHRLYTELTISNRTRPNTSWRRLARKRLTTTSDKHRDAEGRHINDCDNMARQVYTILRQAMTSQVTPVRYRGVRKTPDGAQLQLQVTNRAGRTMQGLRIAVPRRGDAEAITLSNDQVIEPGASMKIDFEPVEHDVAQQAVWTKLQLTQVDFAAVEVDPDDPKAARPGRDAQGLRRLRDFFNKPKR